MYPKGTVNLMPTSQKLWEDASAYNFLSWSYCWDSPWISKANGSVLNKTSVEQYFAGQANSAFLSGRAAGAGLDECNLGNAAASGEREVAAAGFRQARQAAPKNFLAAWGAQEGDELFASLMQDWSFTLAMVEGYSYCPGCGNWPISGGCCGTTYQGCKRVAFPTYVRCNVADLKSITISDFGRLDFARKHGYLNRTVFCFGYV
jgi:hypothetical protein